MTEQEIRNNVPFIQTNDTLSMLSNSLSGALVIKIKRDDISFFLKIVELGEDSLGRLRKIIEIYEQGTIKSLQIIDCGIIEEYSKYYCIFKWIEGEPLNYLYGKLSKQDYYNFGHKIGEDFRKINEVVSRYESFIKKYDISARAKGTADLFKKIYQSNLPLYSNIMSEDYVEKLISRMLDLSKTFKMADKVYIHGDMHPQNIMLNNRELYIIDCETLSIDYFAMNFRWSIGAAFDNEENIGFNLGVIDGFYNGTPPENFYNQLMFTLIHKFFEYTREFYDKKDLNNVINCMKKYKYLFDNINFNLDDNNFLINNADLKTE